MLATSVAKRNGARPVGAATTASSPAHHTPDEKAWLKKLALYRQPDTSRALVELALTATPFVALWVAMAVAIHVSYWLTLILAIPAAGFLVRLHDPARLRTWLVLCPAAGQ